jgi:hypothetical protein
MNSTLDVVISFYGKEWCWPLVKRGLDLNKDPINRIILAYDGPEAPELDFTDLPHLIVTQPRNGWGAARCCNGGVSHVDTDYFVHIDADMMLATNSLRHTLQMAEPDMLLACQIHDTTRDALVLTSNKGLRVRATKIVPEQRPGMWRSPTPLNLRHGHFLAHTASWQELGGHDLTPPNDTEYHSIDYPLAARWMMQFGKESFEFGGGAAFHIGGIADKGEAETPTHKARVQAVLDEYTAKYPEEADAPKWYTP